MSFATDETAVARRNSITELCAAFDQSAADIKTAFALIAEAQNRLRSFFQSDSCSLTILSDSRRGHRPDIENPSATITELSRVVWSSLVGRLTPELLMTWPASVRCTAWLGRPVEIVNEIKALAGEKIL